MRQSFVVNMLMNMENVRDGIPYLKPVVAGPGNWVGGTVIVDERGLCFRMNVLNKPFQKDVEPIEISGQSIRSVAIGRMLIFFKTVDVETDLGLVRFRGGSIQELYEAIVPFCGAD